MSGRGKVIVVGAGVAGLSTALFVQRAGFAVTVVDPLPPASGTSYGNAGCMSTVVVLPSALPGMLRKVPKWLLDPLGPLAVRPSYFPRALPYLLRWLEAGRHRRVLEISDAMAALHKSTHDRWRELLGARREELIRHTGMVQVWQGEKDTKTTDVEKIVRERHGVKTEAISVPEIRKMFPGIAEDVTRGIYVPTTHMTANPQRLVRAIGERLLAEGGTILAEKVMKLIPREGGGFTVMTNVGNHRADQVVVAAGAWSRTIIDPLGLTVPLDTERGYHVMIPSPSVELPMPIGNKDRAYIMTPMEEGLRIAGTVEIAGLDAPPNERRAMIQLENAKSLFPGLTGGEPKLWMGFRPSMPDSLPVLGPVPGRPGLHLAFGHGQWGLSGGPPSGKLVAELLSGERPSIDPKPYAITRFSAAVRA